MINELIAFKNTNESFSTISISLYCSISQLCDDHYVDYTVCVPIILDPCIFAIILSNFFAKLMHVLVLGVPPNFYRGKNGNFQQNF